MPLPDITDPEYIKFFVESCEKNARLRQRWNLLHKDKLQQAATLTRADKQISETDVIKTAMLGGLPAITRDHISSIPNRRYKPVADSKIVPGISSIRKGNSISDVGLGDPNEDPKLARPDTDLSIDPIMRPVNPKQAKILYKPKPEYGRQVYLKSRFRMNPEDKFYFPESYGWQYGWRLKDSSFGRNRSEFGRVYRLRRDQMSRVGPQPDPYYYKEAISTMATTC